MSNPLHHSRPNASIRRYCAVAAVIFCLLPLRRALADGWWNNRFLFRRPFSVAWDAANAEPGQLAELRFYSAGHVNPTGDDIRVVTDSGTLVSSQVLMIGPGDEVRVAFALAPNVRNYYVYFGSLQPPPPPVLPELKYASGLLLETRRRTGSARANTPEQMAQIWLRSGPTVGKTLVDRPFLAGNPFGEQWQTISQYSGQLAAPLGGDYLFAAAASGRGALFIDAQPVLLALFAPADIRFSAHINLTRGRHEFTFYQLHNGNEPVLSIGWRTPGMAKVQLIPANAFGPIYYAIPGRLDALGKRLTADFSFDYLGDCTIGDNDSYRYRFTALLPTGPTPTVLWDFGDGLSSSENPVEHVFLTPHIYHVAVTFKAGAFTDTQSTAIRVGRDFEHPLDPQTDLPAQQSRIVADYDVQKMPLDWLPPAAILHLHAENEGAALKTLRRIAAETWHPDVSISLDAMRQVTAALITGTRRASLLKLWQSVPIDSDLQPRAANESARLFLWWAGDPANAEKVLSPFVTSRPRSEVQRTYAEALILNQKVDPAAKILESLPIADDPRRKPAISGAMARTVEYYISNGDWESGEETWEKWQAQFPAVFLEGYSVVLRVRLMALKHADPTATARIAEDFATAVPNSPYTPELLDRASKLLAAIDPAKSAQLRQELKTRYPEDPLSQD